MFPANARRRHFAKWQTDSAIHRAVAIARKRSIAHDFQRLLNVVITRSDLLRPRSGGGYAGWPHVEQYLRGLLALTEFRKNWLRSVEEWEPVGRGPIRQFASLARHLLAVHPIPHFATLVWLEEPSEKAHRHQKLYKHLGRVGSVRGASLPIPLTKQMARFFMQAPDHLSVEQATRWSQIRGLGGSPPFAAAVVSTRLGDTFDHEAFWEANLRLLIRQRGLDIQLVPPIIEYLRASRGGFLSNPSPPFSGQSFTSFLDGLQRWMERNPDYGKRPRLRWRGSHIGGFRYVEPQQHEWTFRYWTVRELTDSRELVEEGLALRHCVARYANSCAESNTSIWSMESHGSLGSQRVLTIQVLPATRQIVTALGSCNSRPKPIPRRIMQMWAEREGLTIAEWV